MYSPKYELALFMCFADVRNGKKKINIVSGFHTLSLFCFFIGQKIHSLIVGKYFAEKLKLVIQKC